MDRGDLNANKDGISGTAAKEEDYTLDPTGNWSGFLTKSSGTTDLSHSRAHSKANETGTITTSVGTVWASPAHDLAGNMTTLPKASDPATALTAVYDAWNRLVALKQGTTTVAKYRHDGQGRRIIKELYSGDQLSETRHYYYSSQHRVLEERANSSTNADRQYVWGLRYVDELVLRDRDTNSEV